jgi:hypothetical protein
MPEQNPPNRVQTRPKNADQHPGLAIKRKRRTQAEIARDQEIEQKKKEADEKLTERKLRAMATLEDRISANDDRARVGMADERPRPRPRIANKPAKQTKPVSDPDMPNDEDPTTSHPSADDENGTIDPSQVSDEGSGSNDDNFKPPTDDETEDDDEELEEPEDDDFDLDEDVDELPKKKKKRLTDVRDAVRAYRQPSGVVVEGESAHILIYALYSQCVTDDQQSNSHHLPKPKAKTIR